jgi:hypothetical protein
VALDLSRWDERNFFGPELFARTVAVSLLAILVLLFVSDESDEYKH